MPCRGREVEASFERLAYVACVEEQGLSRPTGAVARPKGGGRAGGGWSLPAEGGADVPLLGLGGRKLDGGV